MALITFALCYLDHACSLLSESRPFRPFQTLENVGPSEAETLLARCALQNALFEKTVSHTWAATFNFAL